METQTHGPASAGKSQLRLLTLAALGVVFGDIGTSPLYALRECFYGPHAVAPSHENILGLASLILWSLIIVVSVKYLWYVMRADNHGEGGILALLALVLPNDVQNPRNGTRTILFLGLFGAALLYGDGVITPAISVLSAVEGLKIHTPALEPFVVPAALLILCGLFFLQKYGSGGIGEIFGPLMLLWFLLIGSLGLRGIFSNPAVLRALSPGYALVFLMENVGHSFAVLGAVFLALTGAEALYADLGHFGRKAIQCGWFGVALPALALNYLGQAALLMTNRAAAVNPFYGLASGWMLAPMIVIATIATVIASQAVISGSFSLTLQAVQLDYLPRLEIRHTSSEQIGQIYVPAVNWTLCLITIALVFFFRSSGNLAAAYGVAVSTTMVITTVLMYFVAIKLWKWKWAWAFLLTVLFLAIDLSFFCANAAKFWQGGWFPAMFGVVIFTLLTTWRRGRTILAERLELVTVPFVSFIRGMGAVKARVPGTAVFMVRSIKNTPTALMHNLRHNHILHERILLLKVVTDNVPYVDEPQRLELVKLLPDFYGVAVHYGFKDSPDVPRAMCGLNSLGVPFDPKQVSYFLGRETLISTELPGMARWRENLFSLLARNAKNATAFFRLPFGQVVEMGMQIEI